MKKINRMLAVIITATVLIAATCICASAASAGLSASASSASVGDTLTFKVGSQRHKSHNVYSEWLYRQL